MDNLEQLHNIIEPITEDVYCWLKNNSEYESIVIDLKGARTVRKFGQVPLVKEKPPVTADGKRA